MFVSEAPSSGGQGRTAALVAALALAAIFAAVSAGSAMAATPHVAINHPLQGGYTNNQAPTVSGTTDDLLDPVTLNLYAGANAIGSPVRTATTAFPLASEGWEVTLAPAVEPGEYTAVAEQGLSEVGKSEAVTFTVDTTPPEVSISPVPSPTGDSTPTLKGAAGTAPGDDKTVTVTVYQGSSVGGSIAASENVSAVSGTWSFASPLLADGTYTAQATQGDQAGNSGKSEPVTFVVDTSPPKVNLNQPPSPSKNTTPSFGGTASDST